MPHRDHVCILHVGGTIGMVRGSRGYVPRDGFVEHYLSTMGELSRDPLPGWDLHALPPLLDSADMQPRDWKRIAQAILERYDDYDGFVVLHGTDTMAYTASALSFLLPGLGKPVVLTGSQLSLEDVRSDGREHIITSLLLAGRHDIPEVGIYFGSTLLRGNRTQKVNAHDFVAFSSGDVPPLATAGVSIRLARWLIRRPGPGVPDAIALSREPQVVALRVFPGISDDLLRRVLAPPVEAAVLETYGSGTFPSRQAALLRAIEEAVARDVVVVNCSQCHRGRVRQELYESGAGLARAGVVSGHDMTVEAALTKLFCLLGSGVSPAEARDRIGEDLAGELTRPEEVPPLPRDRI